MKQLTTLGQAGKIFLKMIEIILEEKLTRVQAGR